MCYWGCGGTNLRNVDPIVYTLMRNIKYHTNLEDLIKAIWQKFPFVFEEFKEPTKYDELYTGSNLMKNTKQNAWKVE